MSESSVRRKAIKGNAQAWEVWVRDRSVQIYINKWSSFWYQKRHCKVLVLLLVPYGLHYIFSPLSSFYNPKKETCLILLGIEELFECKGPTIEILRIFIANDTDLDVLRQYYTITKSCNKWIPHSKLCFEIFDCHIFPSTFISRPLGRYKAFSSCFSVR